MLPPVGIAADETERVASRRACLATPAALPAPLELDMGSAQPNRDGSSLAADVHAHCALALEQARLQRQPIRQLTADHPELQVADAVAIAAAGIALRNGGAATHAGWKLGLTSRAKMAQVGVFAPIVGRLCQDMRVDDHGTVQRSAYCHPRIEPEIAFLLARDIDPNAGGAEILAAVGMVLPGLEIIDSRYRDFRFTLPDVIADNTSAAGFVVGGPGESPSGLRARGLELGNLGVIFEVDGVQVDFASTAAILDGPAHALVSLVRSLGAEGQRLRAGDLVLAGAPVAAVPLAGVRHVRVMVEGLGEASVRVED